MNVSEAVKWNNQKYLENNRAKRKSRKSWRERKISQENTARIVSDIEKDIKILISK